MRIRHPQSRRNAAITIVLASLTLTLAPSTTTPLTIARCALAPAAFAQETDGRSAAYWIGQLNSDRFVAREQATLELTRQGVEAVAPLKASIEDGNRETISRGVYVLLKLAMDADGDAAESAYEALRALVASDKRSVAGVARKHINKVHAIRQKGAMVKLIDLGAVLKDETILINRQGQAEAAQTLEIGEKWKGKSEDLRQLRWLYNVRYLAFRTADNKGEWLQYAAKMEALESIAIRGGNVTDEHVVSFVQNQSKLRILDLKYVPISDKSIEPIQKHLTGVVSMKLFGTRITSAGAARLRGQLPKVDVDVRQGGFLGVSCQTHPLGCLVSRVQTGSAANKAGFELGDVIFRYGGVTVTAFDSLTTEIAKHAVEEKVEVQLARGYQNSSLLVGYSEDSLKIKCKPHPLGLEIESLEDESPLTQFKQKPSPFPVAPSFPPTVGDVIVRINNSPIPKDKSADEAFQQAREDVWNKAFEQAKAMLEKKAEKKDKKEEGDAEALDAKARTIADEETKAANIHVQVARGGKVLVKSVVLGAWD